MIYLYTRYKFGNVSTIKAEKWLKKNNIDYQVLSPQSINKYHIKQIIRLSDCIEDILLSPRGAGHKTWEKLGLNEYVFEEMSLNSLIDFLEKKPILLKNLILFDNKRLVTGYNEEKIRAFLSPMYRQIIRQQSLV